MYMYVYIYIYIYSISYGLELLGVVGGVLGAVLWIPVIPKGDTGWLTECEEDEKGQVRLPGDEGEKGVKPVRWREWLFDQAHNAFLNPHRTATETFHILRRMGYWPSLAADCQKWYGNCLVCLQFLTKDCQLERRRAPTQCTTLWNI